MGRRLITSAIHHLNCGTLCPPAARAALGHAHLVCHCLLIETERDGLVLVDTGLGSLDVTTPGRLPRVVDTLLGPRYALGECAVEQVRERGFTPDDVRHIVVTHLHLDHAGGLPDFPRARVHLHVAECFAARTGPTMGERAGYLRAQWSHGARWHTYADTGDTWFGFTGVRPLHGIDASIALVPLVGHTRGHSGVAVETDDGWLLHAGDAYFHRGTLATPPQLPAGMRAFERINSFDNAARLANAARLRHLHETHGDEVDVFCAHDPDELAHYAAR